MRRTTSDSGQPQTYARQRQLLALLETLGDNEGNRDFQKLLFLYCQDLKSTGQAGTATSLYEFVPYRYGAFSFTCYADRRHLVDRGLLIDDDNRWRLTEKGRRVAQEFQDGSMREVVNRYHRLRGNALIAEAYRRHPYYAIRSDIAGQVLKNDKVALRRITDACPKKSPARLSTIGYEGRTLESYLNVLIQSSVTLLCDVRRNAISRKYGFSKTTLDRACDGVGIRYKHLPELGIESRQRQGLKTQIDFNTLFRTYKRHTLPQQRNTLETIRAWLRSGESVALTCYERGAFQCHRHCVVDALERIAECGCNVSHL